jgi:hypothetical protein
MGRSPKKLATAHAAAPARSAIPAPQLTHRASLASRQGAYPSGFRRSSPYTSLPFPFLGDFFNLDDIYSTGYPVASQPPIILLQAAHALFRFTPICSDSSERTGALQSPSTQPLMIELQNGRYVRVTSTPANGEALPLEPRPRSTQ